MIKNKEDWWTLLNEHWIYIRDIVFNSISPFAPAYELPGNAKTKPTGRTIDGELEYLRETKDPKMHNYLNKAWCMSSDAYAWSVPSWGAFCDLCSENWVFDEDHHDNVKEN